MGSALEEALVVASRQRGVITYEQAKSAGLTRGMVAGLADRGDWVRVMSGIYRLRGAPQNREQELWIGALWLGDRGAFSHFTAAEILRLEGIPTQRGLDVITGKSSRDAPKATLELRTHRARAFDPRRERTKVNGLYVTNGTRTLLDLAERVTESQLEMAILDAVRRSLIDPEQFQKRVDRLSGQGRRNIDALRQLAGAEHTAIKVDSVLEMRVLSLIAEAGLPVPKAQKEVFDGGRRLGTFDFVYEDQRLIIECDGRNAHDRRKTFESDREKDNDLAAIGWRRLRLTHEMATRGRKKTQELIRRTLETPLGSVAPAPLPNAPDSFVVERPARRPR